jgi:hypothetical protein
MGECKDGLRGGGVCMSEMAQRVRKCLDTHNDDYTSRPRTSKEDVMAARVAGLVFLNRRVTFVCGGSFIYNFESCPRTGHDGLEVEWRDGTALFLVSLP